MIKTIVIATDGSDHAEKAVAFGADIAAKYGARVVLVHSLLRKEISENLREMARVEHLAGEEGKAIASAVAAIPEGRFPASIVFEEKGDEDTLQGAGSDWRAGPQEGGVDRPRTWSD